MRGEKNFKKIIEPRMFLQFNKVIQTLILGRRKKKNFI